MPEFIQVKREQAVVTLTIDRQKALNALNEGVLTEILHEAQALERDESVRVVIVTGAGEKAFVAGADIKAMANMSPVAAERFSALGHRAFAALEALPAPVIAAVGGFALGGGLELAMAADVIYASENAKFGQPEVNLGLIPGFGGTVRLARLVGRQAAAELLFTGDMIDAARAKALGLVAEVFPRAELLAAVTKIAEKIAQKGPLAVAALKRTLRAAQEVDLKSACEAESRAFGLLFSTQDQREGCEAFIAGRPAVFKGI